MLKVKVETNLKDRTIKSNIDAKKTHTGEVMYLMALLYKMIKENDETGITDKEMFADIKNMAKELERQDKERGNK